MKQIKLVIFDWDGTLMNSVGRIVSSMQSAAKNVGLIVPTDDAAKQIIGLSLPIGLKKLFVSITDEQVEAMLIEYKYQYLVNDTTPTPLFDNADNLLTNLQRSNKLLAVATGKGREGLERVLDISGAKHYFNTTRCAGEMQSKPDPEMINSILDELDIPAHMAVMIGDTSHDLKMAQNAGVSSIGITLGVDDRAELEKYKPIHIVDSLFELEDILL
jgi:phosphoglycolate phosphatase